MSDKNEQLLAGLPQFAMRMELLRRAEQHFTDKFGSPPATGDEESSGTMGDASETGPE